MKRLIHISSLILLLMGGFATAAELHVSPTGPYTTIQSAIDAAAEGDVVKVADGTYTGVGNRNLTFRGKAITVRSENGPDNCIIDCQRSGRGFGFYNGEKRDSEVDGFTIREGRADYGGGIDCYYASPTIVNCVIRDCHADMDGGAIACFESNPLETNANKADPWIFNCLLVNNSAGGYGGGAISCDGSSAWITACTLVGNTTSGDGGGVYCYYNADARIRYSILVDCGSYAVYEADDSSNPLVKYCLFYNNEPNDYYDLSGFLGGRGLSGGDAINALTPDTSVNEGNIDGDPLFRTGPLGDYYLSQVVAGQLADSSCVDAGSGAAGPLAGYTTATNNTLEGTSTLDLGYHYTDTGPVGTYGVVASVDVATPYGTVSADRPGPYQQYSEVLLMAMPDYGYEVERWSGDVDGTPFLNVDDPCHNIVTLLEPRTHNATVRFKERVPWELTTYVEGGVGGAIDPCGVTVQFEGVRVKLTAIPDLGYTVKRWEGTENDASVDLINYVTLYSDRTVYVEFIASDVYLDTRVDPNTPYGRIRPRSGYRLLDLAGASPVEITALPDEGYRVETWYINDEPFLDPGDRDHISLVMDEDKEVVVRFEVRPFYHLTTTVVGGQGELLPESGPQYGGQTITLTAVPADGWRVRQWTGTDDDSSLEATNTVFLDSDKEVTVEFEEGLPYNTVWVANPLTGEPYPRSSLYKNPYPTIQAAIDAAVSAFPGYEGDEEASPFPLPELPNLPGDIVLVADGVYKGDGNKDLVFFSEDNDRGLTGVLLGDPPWAAADRIGDYKVITVRSEHGPESCIIDCEGSGTGFSFSNLEWNDAVVEGFTIKNGSGFLGGALNVTGPSGPVFRNCIITDCSAANGGGVYFEGLADDDTTYGDLLEEAEAVADAAEEAAEATDPPFMDFDLNLTAMATRIWANVYAGLVEGVSAPDTNRPTLSNCKVTGNTSDGHGGGIYCSTNASPVVMSTEISHNEAGGGGLPGAHGGGVYCAETGGTPPAFINCLITGNSSTEIGGTMSLGLMEARFPSAVSPLANQARLSQTVS
ncbi:MAG: InlB B-repeat-containing protein [Planctomycetota bacterium]